MTFTLYMFLFYWNFSAVTASKANDNFYFDPSPINQDVVEGSSVELRCDVSNRKHIIFYWELNNKKVGHYVNCCAMIYKILCD